MHKLHGNAVVGMHEIQKLFSEGIVSAFLVDEAEMILLLQILVEKLDEHTYRRKLHFVYLTNYTL